MNDLGRALKSKVEIITQRWIEAVHQDTEIESARQLAYESVRNSLPEVLKELACLLSPQLPGDEEKLEEKSLHHGWVRAKQGYDTAEIVREYRLLRQVILSVLEPDLLTGSASSVLDTVRLIDRVFDDVVTASMESYIESRLIELRQMQSQLTLTNQELTRLVNVHKENLSYMAHELKTPLTSIIGHSSVLLQKQRKKLDGKDTATNLEQIERVLRNGRKLLQIINDTLEISRYNQGQIALSPAPTKVGDLITEIIEDALVSLAEEKRLELTYDVTDAPPTVVTDSLRVQQLVTNLVGNAIRYTQEGSVHVVCQQRDDRFWEIRVSDTGIGIEEEERSQIFDPYTRSTAQTRSIAGTGLGLAIVQSIVTLMKGQIELVSEINKGSTFSIILPLVLPDA